MHGTATLTLSPGASSAAWRVERRLELAEQHARAALALVVRRGAHEPGEVSLELLRARRNGLVLHEALLVLGGAEDDDDLALQPRGRRGLGLGLGLGLLRRAQAQARPQARAWARAQRRPSSSAAAGMKQSNAAPGALVKPYFHLAAGLVFRACEDRH